MTARDRWNARYRDPRTRVAREPNAYLVSQAHHLKGAGRAIDVAGGAGSNAVWLAQRGFDVTLADVSEVALALATERAAQVGVSLATVRVDLESEPFPQGPWSAVLVTHFLHRPLYAAAAAALAPGGLLIAAHPTRRNLERHAHPSARFLLDDEELLGLIRGLTILDQFEGWVDGRHESRVVAARITAEEPAGRLS